MKTIRSLISAAALTLAVFLPTTASAQVPQIINYQGKIAVGTAPFTGAGQFRFALVDGTGANSFWSNDGTSTAGAPPTAAVSLPVVNGLYVVPLGDTSIAGMLPVPATVFSNSDVRLRVWFNDGTNGSQLLTPDQRITAVGYAMAANTALVANTVPDGAITAAKIAPAARPRFDRQLGLLPGGFVNIGVSTGPTYTDIPGMSLTTKNLGEAGTYVINFRITEQIQNGAFYNYTLNINGTTIPASIAYSDSNASVGSYCSPSLHYVAAGLAAGSVIKIQVQNAGPTGPTFFYAGQLTIDGVPSSQVVP